MQRRTVVARKYGGYVARPNLWYRSITPVAFGLFAAGNSAVTIMACILSRPVRRVARILLSVTTRGYLRGNITFGAFSDARNWLDPSMPANEACGNSNGENDSDNPRLSTIEKFTGALKLL